MKLSTYQINLLRIVQRMTKGDHKVSDAEFYGIAKKFGLSKYGNYKLINFYNNNFQNSPDWASIDFDSEYYDSLEFKIRQVQKNYRDWESYFSETDDNNETFFHLYIDIDPSIDFNYDSVDFNFGYNSDNGLKMLNIEELEYHIYSFAKDGQSGYGDGDDRYGDGDDRYGIITMFNNENIELLSTLLTYLNRQDLSSSLLKLTKRQNNWQQRQNLYVHIGKFLDDQSYTDHIINDIESVYNTESSYASDKSVIKEFNSQIPKGINIDDKSHFNVTYDYLLAYLEKNREIKYFSDMLNVPLIDSEVYLQDSIYQYDDWFDNESFNKSIKETLKSAIDDVEDNDEIQSLLQNKYSFEQIITNLKFRKISNGYSKKIKGNNNSLRIPFQEINYYERKLILYITNNKKVKKYSVPFDELTDYVNSNLLFERLSKLAIKTLLV